MSLIMTFAWVNSPNRAYAGMLSSTVKLSTFSNTSSSLMTMVQDLVSSRSSNCTCHKANNKEYYCASDSPARPPRASSEDRGPKANGRTLNEIAGPSTSASCCITWNPWLPLPTHLHVGADLPHTDGISYYLVTVEEHVGNYLYLVLLIHLG